MLGLIGLGVCVWLLAGAISVDFINRASKDYSAGWSLLVTLAAPFGVVMAIWTFAAWSWDSIVIEGNKLTESAKKQ